MSVVAEFSLHKAGRHHVICQTFVWKQQITIIICIFGHVGLMVFRWRKLQLWSEVLTLELADQYISQSSDHNVTGSHETNYSAAFQISKQESEQDVKARRVAASRVTRSTFMCLYEPKRTCILQILSVLWEMLMFTFDFLRKRIQKSKSVIWQSCAEAMEKLFFLQTTSSSSRIPTEPNQPSLEPSCSDWTPQEEPKSKTSVWAPHPPLLLPPGTHTTRQKPKRTRQMPPFRERLQRLCCPHLLLLLRWACVHPKLKDRNRDIPQMLQPPIPHTARPRREAEVCRKEKAAGGERCILRGRLLAADGRGRWLSGKESGFKGWGGGQTERDAKKDESHNKGYEGWDGEGGCLIMSRCFYLAKAAFQTKGVDMLGGCAVRSESDHHVCVWSPSPDQTLQFNGREHRWVLGIWLTTGAQVCLWGGVGGWAHSPRLCGLHQSTGEVINPYIPQSVRALTYQMEL